jgi:hypothetical protein
MQNPSKYLLHLAVLATALLVSSCFVENPWDTQQVERDFSIVDFERLEMGNAFNIEVRQGNLFHVSARGDRRDIEDLIAEKEGLTLVIRYNESRNHRQIIHVTVTMPELQGVNFSAASESRISGFSSSNTLTLALSGASVCQLEADAGEIECLLSGASYLSLRGSARSLGADVSGASVLNAFDFPVAQARLVMSGASDGRVTVSDVLTATATGASNLLYRGDPSVDSEVSGASSVDRDDEGNN